MPGIKHLVECHCVLAIYRTHRKDKQVYHKFPVYSKIDKNDSIVPKLCKCNNCDTMHYVYDICKSEIRGGKDQSELTISIEEMSYMLPERLAAALIKIDTDISNWEHIVDIYEESRWGESVVLRRDIIDERQHLKIIEIVSENKFKFKNSAVDDIIL